MFTVKCKAILYRTPCTGRILGDEFVTLETAKSTSVAWVILIDNFSVVVPFWCKSLIIFPFCLWYRTTDYYFNSLFLFFFVFVAALLLLLVVYQVLTLLEDLSYSQRHQSRILVSLVLKGLRRNLTAKLGHLLKQRCNYFFLSEVLMIGNYLLYVLQTLLTKILLNIRLLISSRLNFYWNLVSIFMEEFILPR